VPGWKKVAGGFFLSNISGGAVDCVRQPLLLWTSRKQTIYHRWSPPDRQLSIVRENPSRSSPTRVRQIRQLARCFLPTRGRELSIPSSPAPSLTNSTPAQARAKRPAPRHDACSFPVDYWRKRKRFPPFPRNQGEKETLPIRLARSQHIIHPRWRGFCQPGLALLRFQDPRCAACLRIAAGSCEPQALHHR